MKLPEPPPYLRCLYKDVADFWTAFELPIRRCWMDASPAGMALAANLVAEEFNEYLNAPTPVEQLDGLVDLAYVLFGAVHAIGMPLETINARQNYAASTLAGNVASITKEFNRSFTCCWRLMDTCLPAAIVQTCQQGEVISTSFHKAFNAVHAANMSKLWKEPVEDDTLIFKRAGNGMGWIGRRVTDGKIVKPPTFVHPDLSKFLK